MSYISEILLSDLFEDRFYLYSLDLKNSELYRKNKGEIIQQYITYDEQTIEITKKILEDNRVMFQKILQGSIRYDNVHEQDDSMRLLQLNQHMEDHSYRLIMPYLEIKDQDNQTSKGIIEQAVARYYLSAKSEEQLSLFKDGQGRFDWYDINAKLADKDKILVILNEACEKLIT